MLRRKEAKIIVGSDVLRRASQKDMLVSEQEAEKKAEELMKQSLVTLKQLKKNALGRLKIRGYILCGILALAWPLVGGFRIYYPIISIVCFALAVISYKKGSNAKENTDIGTT